MTRMVIRFNQLGSGVGGVLINDRWGLVGVVYIPGALQEKLEPMHTVCTCAKFI